MPDTSVKYFDSTMSGAPVLTGAAGSLLAVLDALVSGFGQVAVSSITITNNIATVTTSGNHGFAMIGSAGAQIGPVIQLDNVTTPAALNGQWRIASVPTSATFTLATSGLADQSATGTITAKRAGAGWTKPYTDTNKAVYKAGSVYANGALLRIDDTIGKVAGALLYESMTSVDAGTNASPAGYINKYQSGVPQWWLIADDLFWHLVTATIPGSDDYIGGYYFGDLIKPIGATNMYSTVIAVDPNNRSSGQPYNDSCSAYSFGTSPGRYLTRGLATSSVMTAYEFSTSMSGGGAGFGLLSYNVAADPLLHAAVIYVRDTGVAFRGQLPGCLAPMYSGYPPVGSYMLQGKVFMSLNVGGVQGNGGRVLYDLSGPWR